ncbi:MAG: hypothetical protein QM758_10260 [Armatimonas sp.]
MNRVRVFVALCDNKTQGIVPVPPRIGNGDDPDNNLYWGCDDGMGSYFPHSAHWRVTKSEKNVAPHLLRRLSIQHTSSDISLEASAYRGSQMARCLQDFERVAVSGKYDLVAFIGHNGLMDAAMAPPPRVPGNRTEVAVLCCLSARYFGARLRALGCRPILMTSQLMYPGSFLLDAAIEQWRRGGSLKTIRLAAARAYARNQKISVRAAAGVFA